MANDCLNLFVSSFVSFSINGLKQNAENIFKLLPNSEICPEMHALAKMAEMAISRQNRQTIKKNSNEMAKGPFGKWRFRRKCQKWRLIAKHAKL